jgi:hypothetical protein
MQAACAMILKSDFTEFTICPGPNNESPPQKSNNGDHFFVPAGR